MDRIRLAIVIPYYKIRHFKETLDSIAAQSDQRFNLYIGDDHSADNPEPLIAKAFGPSRSNISYIRFNDNLGSKSLVKQWERCIGLSNAEEYIWLFSDDDVMPQDAVERFYDFLEQFPGSDLYRFNLKMIDAGGKVTSENKSHPMHETAHSFLLRRLKAECLSAACEYIFTREIFDRLGGFKEFPLAWASDDATWILFADEKGIYTIPGQSICWRFGGESISSANDNYKPKLDAAFEFIEFVNAKFIIDSYVKLNWLFFNLRLLKFQRRACAYFIQKFQHAEYFSWFDFISFFLKKSYLKVFAAVNEK